MKLSVAAYRAIAELNRSRQTRDRWQRGSTAYGSVNGGSPSHSLSIEEQTDKQPEIKSAFDGHSDQIYVSSGSSSIRHKSSSVSPSLSRIQTSRQPCNKKSDEAPQVRKDNKPEVKKFMSNQRSLGNQRWMKLRTTVQLTGAVSALKDKKPPLKREDSFLKRFSTRHTAEIVATDYGDDEDDEDDDFEDDQRSDVEAQKDLPLQPQLLQQRRQRQRRRQRREKRFVINPDENFYFWWLTVITCCVLYNYWTLIVRQAFPELQSTPSTALWHFADGVCDFVFILDIGVQFRTGYLEQGLMVYDSRKLAKHYVHSRAFALDIFSLFPLDLLRLLVVRPSPLFRFPRFLKVYRSYHYYYMVESRTLYPNLWRVVNLVHILLLLAHWFGCFYYLLSEAESFIGEWVYPNPVDDFAHLTRKYLASVYWSTLTLTTIGDLPTPESDIHRRNRPPVEICTNGSVAFMSNNITRTIRSSSQRNVRRGFKSRVRRVNSNLGYLFTIVSYLCGVFVFATIVGQVGNVITNRNANRLEFERLLDGAKLYMRHHKVPRDMQRRVQRWYDYTWSRGRMHAGGDINTALGILPDKLKTELALHVNLNTLKKVTIFQECQPEFLHDLVLKMKAYIFTPGDVICRKGEVAREMFIIADGILEVISENGKVLTTMKAGDFFGEIGILNLDGLNRRTADVRSVGYAELFSLSREDVLSAMKDYPEAQEILQSMGKKRLMEARKAAAKSKKEMEETETTEDNDSAKESTKDEDNDGLHEEEGSGVENDGSALKVVKKLKRDANNFKNYILRNSSKSFRSASNSSTDEVRIEMETVNTGRRLSKRRSTVANDRDIPHTQIIKPTNTTSFPSSSAIQIGDNAPPKPPATFLQRVLALKNTCDGPAVPLPPPPLPLSPLQPSHPENKDIKCPEKAEEKSSVVPVETIEAWGATVELIRPDEDGNEKFQISECKERPSNASEADKQEHHVKSILKHFSRSESDVSDLLSIEKDDKSARTAGGLEKRKLTKTVSFRDHYLKSPVDSKEMAYKAEECIADLLIGIKQILQIRLDDIQEQFRSRLVALESAMKDKDEMVRHIEHKIKDLENGSGGQLSSNRATSLSDIVIKPTSNQAQVHEVATQDDDCILTHPGYVSHPRRSWPMLPSRQRLVHQRSCEDFSQSSTFWLPEFLSNMANYNAMDDTDVMTEMETDELTENDGNLDSADFIDLDDRTLEDDDEDCDEDEDTVVQVDDESPVEETNWEIKMLAKEILKKELVSKLSNVMEEGEEEEDDDDNVFDEQQTNQLSYKRDAEREQAHQRPQVSLADSEVIQKFVHNTLVRLEKLEKVFTKKPGLIRQQSLQEQPSSKLKMGLHRQASCGHGDSSSIELGSANNSNLSCSSSLDRHNMAVSSPSIISKNDTDVKVRLQSLSLQSPPTDDEDTTVIIGHHSKDPESQPLIKPK